MVDRILSTVSSFGHPPSPRQYRKDVDKLEQVLCRTSERLEYVSCKERLRDRGLRNLEKRQVQGASASPDLQEDTEMTEPASVQKCIAE